MIAPLALKIIHRYYRDKSSFVYKKIKKFFPACLDKKGNIIRNKLRDIAFLNNTNLKKIERIVHPAVIKDLKNWAKDKKTKRGIYVAEIPLLFEKKLDKIFNKVILVCASESILLKRIKERFDIPRQAARKRLSLYLPVNEKKKLSDFIIHNNSSEHGLKRKVEVVWQKLKKKS